MAESVNCTNQECGCHVSTLTTQEKCPECGGKLRLAGNMQTVQFRLSCAACNYQSALLSTEELSKLL